MMRLSPLQSRLAASLAATLMLVALYLMLSWPRLAMATEVPVPAGIVLDDPNELRGDLQPSYEPEFALFDRSIVGRAPAGVTALVDNVPEALNLQPGTTACYLVAKSTIFGDDSAGSRLRRDDESDGDDDDYTTPTKTVYLSANTCLQPHWAKEGTAKSTPPQLSLIVSQSTQGVCPTLSDTAAGVQRHTFQDGAVMLSVNATKDVYITVAAPNVTADWDGVYNFELAASTDDYYYTFDTADGAELLWMDSDSSSVLLVTKNLTENSDKTQQIMKEDPPYELFVENSNRGDTNGLRRSVCGLNNNAQILANGAGNGMLHELVQTRMTTRGPGGFPKQQFYFEGLNASSSYTGVLYKPSSSSSNAKRDGQRGGGGTLFVPTQFQTSSGKSQYHGRGSHSADTYDLPGTNCKVITDLDFCDEIQYAAPGNGDLSNTELAKKYDDNARKMYSNFEKVMMQIPCEASPEDSYSLVRNCDDCKKAYKRWLCTVSIPRCEDFNTNNTHTIVRNAAQAFPNGTKLGDDQLKEFGQKPGCNTSRNPFIDKEIKPGPYREILPCEDICYEVVQSCPASIGFTCPRPNQYGFDASYGRRSDDNSEVTCNFPGETRTKTGAATSLLPRMLVSCAIPLILATILATW